MDLIDQGLSRIFYGKDEVATLEKLEELGVIKILNPGGTSEYE
jgi:hypothetical protein